MLAEGEAAGRIKAGCRCDEPRIVGTSSVRPIRCPKICAWRVA